MEQSEIKFNLKQFKSITYALSTYDDLSLLMNHLAEGTALTFGAKGCCIMIFDEEEKQLFTISSYGISDEYLGKGGVFVDDKYTALVTGEPVFIENMQDDKTIQYPEAAKAEGIVSMFSAPIKYRNATLGVVRLYQDTPRPLHEEDVDSLRVLSATLGLVLEINGLRNFLDMVKMAMDSLPQRMS